MSDPTVTTKTLAEELSAIAMSLFDTARDEAERGVMTGGRMIALGIAAGAVLRTKEELLRNREAP